MKKQLLILSFILGAFNTYAQTRASDSILHVKYWNYRQNFLKYLTIVGPTQGMSVPGSKINKWANPMYCDSFRITINKVTGVKKRIKLPSNTPHLPEYSYFADYGDATAHYAEYLGVLATEYWLLKHYNTDTMGLKAVKNEIYFALNAIDRLDKYSERYSSQNPNNEKLNGFIHRDDLPNRHLEDLYKYDRHAPRNNFGNTSGVYHIDTMHIGGKVIYFGPDSIQLKPEKNTWDFGYKRPEWEVHKAGQPSQDQMIGILTGLKFVQNYVDWDLEVDPDGNLPEFDKRNLVSWTAQIADRMLKKISETAIGIKYFDEETNDRRMIAKCKRKNGCNEKDPCPPCDTETECREYNNNNPILANSANYVLKDENGNHVFRGPYACFGFGYPLEKLGEELASANNAVRNPNYPSVTVRLDDEEQVMRYGGDILTAGAFFLGGSSVLGGVVIGGLTGAAGIPTGCPQGLSPDILSLCLVGKPFLPRNSVWWQDIWNAIPNKVFFTNRLKGDQGDLTMNMIQWLAPASSTWNQSGYNNLLDLSDRPYMDLYYATQQNISALKPKSYYADLLNKAQFNNHTFMNKANETINAPWSKGSLFSNVHNEYKDEFQGVSSGLDYMLIYNMYRINSIRFWGDSYNKYFNDPSPNGDGEFWEIEVNPRHIHILDSMVRDEQYRGSTKVESGVTLPLNKWIIKFRENLPYKVKNEWGQLIVPMDTFQSKVPYSSYLNYGIQTPDIVSTNFNVNSNGVFIINYLVNVVNHKKFTVNNGGKLFVKEAPKYTSGLRHKLYIRDGSTLELKSGSILTIENNAEVIIPKGATLTIHPGAQIILNGPNAVIHINGRMILKPNADFNPIAGTNGYGKVVFENNAGELYVTCEGNNKMIINPGTMGSQLNLEAKGAYGMHTGWQPGLKLFEVKNAKVGIAAGSKITSEAEKTIIENIHMMGHNWPKNENEYSNGIMAYSTNVEIQNSTFDFLENAITFSYYPNNPTFKQIVKNNIFTKCKTGVKMNDGTALIENNQFNSNRIGKYGINTVSGGSLSFIKGNTFNVTYSNLQNQWHWSKGSAAVAVNFFNSGGLMLNKNLFHSSTRGLNNKDTRVQLYCNRFHAWNDGENAIYSIQSNGGKLSLKNGYNLFEHYKHYINSNNSKIVLDGGYNLFNLSNQTYPFLMRVVEKEKLELSADYTLSHVNDFLFWQEIIIGKMDIHQSLQAILDPILPIMKICLLHGGLQT